MYPRQECTLYLDDIARDWANELPQSPSVDDARTLLVQAFWKGDLVASLKKPAIRGVDQRELVLDLLREFKGHPNLAVVNSEDEVRPPTISEHPDGLISHDPLWVVVWPPNSADRDLATFQRAVEVLAKVPWHAYRGDFVSLSLIEISRSDFETFCRANGFKLPAFWFGPSKQDRSSKALIDCRNWLQAEARRHGNAKRQSKADYRDDAIGRFTGLAARQFDMIWNDVVPDSWSNPGAPRGRRRQTVERSRKS